MTVCASSWGIVDMISKNTDADYYRQELGRQPGLAFGRRRTLHEAVDPAGLQTSWAPRGDHNEPRRAPCYRRRTPVMAARLTNHG